MNRSLFIKSVFWGSVIMSFMISCGTRRFAYTPVTFDIQTSELHGYKSLTFWRKPNTYVEYSPMSSCIIGTWNVKSDTLVCIPKILYAEYEGRFSYDLINPRDTTVVSIPHVFILNKDFIKEITDYTVVYRSMESNTGVKFQHEEGVQPTLQKVR